MAHNRKIAVIGLGYVGLPVAVAFARTASVLPDSHTVTRAPSSHNSRAAASPLWPSPKTTAFFLL